MDVLNKFDKVVILGPHVDDGEFGCGATIAKLIEQKKDIYYITFSFCEDSIMPPFEKNVLIKELNKSSKILNIPKSNIISFNFKVRHFNQFRQDILEKLVAINNELKPNLVILPSSFDIHQDHQTIFNEGLRAFKYCSIIGYELCWNNITFSSTIYSIISEQQLDIKISSISQYKSQNSRNYANTEIIKSLARIRGMQIKQPYAEAFEVIRLIF